MIVVPMKGTDMRKQNIGAVERVLRVVLGGALAVWAVVLLLGGGGFIWLLLDVALIALGVDFVVTGIRGYCPLYNRLGWTTARPQHG
jgi:hypothetical protein